MYDVASIFWSTKWILLWNVSAYCQSCIVSNAYSSGTIYDTPLTVVLPKSKIDQMPIYATPSFGSPVHYNSSLSTPPSHMSKPKIEQMPIYATPSVGIPSSPRYDDICRTPVPSVQQTMMSTTAAAAATSGARDPRRHFVSLQQLLYVHSTGARDPCRHFV